MGRTLYVTWNSEMLSRGKTDRCFYISDEFAVPLNLVWDSDIYHEALVPFDEKMVIDAYMKQCGGQAENKESADADRILGTA